MQLEAAAEEAVTAAATASNPGKRPPGASKPSQFLFTSMKSTRCLHPCGLEIVILRKAFRNNLLVRVPLLGSSSETKNSSKTIRHVCPDPTDAVTGFRGQDPRTDGLLLAAAGCMDTSHPTLAASDHPQPPSLQPEPQHLAELKPTGPVAGRGVDFQVSRFFVQIGSIVQRVCWNAVDGSSIVSGGHGPLSWHTILTISCASPTRLGTFSTSRHLVSTATLALLSLNHLAIEQHPASKTTTTTVGLPLVGVHTSSSFLDSLTLTHTLALGTNNPSHLPPLRGFYSGHLQLGILAEILVDSSWLVSHILSSDSDHRGSLGSAN
ncbi:hypothetical protein LIA77_02363 [Sarocladium implicatum]|nr:hypothetical protein LIA77_02363 [Sarocladium implicatum]